MRKMYVVENEEEESKRIKTKAKEVREKYNLPLYISATYTVSSIFFLHPPREVYYVRIYYA